MPTLTRLQKIIVGVATVGGVAYLFDTKKENPARSSWTTNYIPSVKWDDNWDQ